VQHTAGRSVEFLSSTRRLDRQHGGCCAAIYPSIRLVSQANARAGSSAQSRRARRLAGRLSFLPMTIAFPTSNWLDANDRAFLRIPTWWEQKGVYRTCQKSLVATRFVQIEYEDKIPSHGAPLQHPISSIRTPLRSVATVSWRWRVTTHSFPAGLRRSDNRLSIPNVSPRLEDEVRPDCACLPTSPSDTLSKYLKKKYKFAFWRILAVRKNRSKAVKDSHTPQLMTTSAVIRAHAGNGAGS